MYSPVSKVPLEHSLNSGVQHRPTPDGERAVMALPNFAESGLTNDQKRLRKLEDIHETEQCGLEQH